MKKTRITNTVLLNTIVELEKISKKNDAKAYKAIAKTLSRPNRIRAKVNVYKIDRMFKDNIEYYLVPGKVLGTGTITKKVNVAAFEFSDQARKKITAAGGKCFNLVEAAKANPKASKVMILG